MLIVVSTVVQGRTTDQFSFCRTGFQEGAADGIYGTERCVRFLTLMKLPGCVAYNSTFCVDDVLTGVAEVTL